MSTQTGFWESNIEQLQPYPYLDYGSHNEHRDIFKGDGRARV